MDTRGEQLAARFEHVSGAFVAAFESLDETDLAPEVRGRAVHGRGVGNPHCLGL